MADKELDSSLDAMISECARVFDLHQASKGAELRPWERDDFLVELDPGPFRDEMERMVELLKAGPLRIYRNSHGDVELAAPASWKAENPGLYVWAVVVFYDTARDEAREHIAPKLDPWPG